MQGKALLSARSISCGCMTSMVSARIASYPCSVEQRALERSQHEEVSLLGLGGSWLGPVCACEVEVVSPWLELGAPF